MIAIVDRAFLDGVVGIGKVLSLFAITDELLPAFAIAQKSQFELFVDAIDRQLIDDRSSDNTVANRVAVIKVFGFPQFRNRATVLCSAGVIEIDVLSVLCVIDFAQPMGFIRFGASGAALRITDEIRTDRLSGIKRSCVRRVRNEAGDEGKGQFPFILPMLGRLARFSTDGMTISARMSK